VDRVHKWGVFEAEFRSRSSYADPLRDVSLTCIFRSPSGEEHTVDAFWDGSSTWRVRFMPDETGLWTYRTACSNEEDEGLNRVEGSFECTPYEGGNPLYVHGPLKLSENRRYLVHSDGTPFFWLADTAWNGVIKSSEREWEEYLAFRSQQGFTVVQFVMTHWVGGVCDLRREKAYVGRDRIASLNVDFFKRIDPKFAMVNRFGIVAAPVLLWAAEWSRRYTVNPGYRLAEEDAVLLARYLTARYGAYIVVWILAGDGDYKGVKAERWRRIGRAVFPEGRRRQPVTMHPCGKQWILPEFQDEEWLDIIGYQSGHGADEEDLRWLCLGPPSQGWRTEPPRPVINLEPNYEDHLAYGTGRPITPYMVRRAAYWSLLVSPPAGVSYGTNGVWYWARRHRVPANHPGIGVAKPWRRALRLPGAAHMSILKSVLTSIQWWRLAPSRELLLEQPGYADVESFVAAAASSDGALALVYTPRRQSLKLNLGLLKRPLRASWVNPSTGERTECGILHHERALVEPPGPGDWLLVLEHVDCSTPG